MAEALVDGVMVGPMAAVRRAVMRVAGVTTMMVVTMPRSMTTVGMVAESC